MTPDGKELEAKTRAILKKCINLEHMNFIVSGLIRFLLVGLFEVSVCSLLVAGDRWVYVMMPIAEYGSWMLILLQAICIWSTDRLIKLLREFNRLIDEQLPLCKGGVMNNG